MNKDIAVMYLRHNRDFLNSTQVKEIFDFLEKEHPDYFNSLKDSKKIVNEYQYDLGVLRDINIYIEAIPNE